MTVTAETAARGVQHRCSHRVSTRCAGPTSGRPKRQKCPVCGGAFAVTEGTYAVVPWRGDGRYFLAQAVATYARDAAAGRRAAKEGMGYIVRFIPL